MAASAARVRRGRHRRLGDAFHRLCAGDDRVPDAWRVWLIDGSQDRGAAGARWAPARRAAFGAGWWWGFGYFTAGLWWLGAAFLVEPQQFAWALPLGVLGLPAVLAFFPAFAFAFARALWSTGPRRVLAFAVAFTAVEWLRSMLFTGFPWNDIGMTLGANLVTAQIAAFVGLHGLTFLTVLIGAAPATLWTRPAFGVGGPRRSFRPASRRSVCACFGGLRSRGAGNAPTVARTVKLRLVQPNVAQDADFAPENGAAIVKRYLTLSDRATSPTTGVADVTHLFWPESAFPFLLLARTRAMLKGIADFLQGGAILITGAARAERD